MFARLPAAVSRYSAPHWRRGSSPGQLRPFRIVTVGDLLFDRRADVFAALAVCAYDDVGFAGLAAARRRHRYVRPLDRSISGWIFDPLFLRVSMGGHRRISLDKTRKARANTPGSVFIADRLTDSSLVHKIAREPW